MNTLSENIENEILDIDELSTFCGKHVDNAV